MQSWAVYGNDVLSTDLLDLMGVGAAISTIAEAIYKMHEVTGNPPESWAMLRGTRTRCVNLPEFRNREGGPSMNVGDMAPEFSLPGTTGPGLDLAQIRGKQRAALFFYPADRTSG